MPHAQFGGIYDVIGGGINMYPHYLTRYNWIIDEDSPMELDMKILRDDSGDLIFSADVEMTGEITSSNNKIIFIITKYWNNSYFCTVSRYNEMNFDLTDTGETGTYQTVLDLDDSWDLDDLKAVVLIQTLSGDHKIYQAGISDIQSIMQVIMPERADFGDVPVGQSVTEQLQIINYWDEELTGAAFPIPGFDIAANFTVPPNQTLALDLTFTPEEEIEYDSFIILMSNNDYFQTQLVPVTGAGISGTGSNEDLTDLPAALIGNHPNPFNPTTTIEYNVDPNEPDAYIEILNLKGEVVMIFSDLEFIENSGSVIWDGKDFNSNPVSSGIYFYKLTSGQNSTTKKMMLLK